MASAPDGFYDLYEAGPGTYRITATVAPPGGCTGVSEADDSAQAAIVDGGSHTDIALPCRPLGDVYIASVDSAGQSFEGCSNPALTAACQVYPLAGSTDSYTDGTPITTSSFTADLSGPDGSDLPGTSLAQTVPPDEVFAEETTSGMSYAFDPAAGAAYGDVPAAPTAVQANWSNCAFSSGTGCSPGLVVTWDPPPNQDVSGAEATPGGATDSVGGNATYAVWRQTVAGGGTSQLMDVGRIAVVPEGWAGPIESDIAGGVTPVQAPRFVDDQAQPGQTYVYFVVPFAASGTGGATGPASGISAPVTVPA